MPRPKKNKPIDVSKLSDKALESLLQRANAELDSRAKAKEKAQAGKGLETFSSYEDMANELMSEWWDDSKEAAFVDGLLGLAAASMGDPAYDEIAAIIEEMGSASQARDELENMSAYDEESEGEYAELEESFYAHVKEAIDLLKRFWKKYVDMLFEA